MKVLFVAGEALPYIKTGGLADVMGSLPKELVKKGIDARVCIPLYKPVTDRYLSDMKKEVSFDFYTGDRYTPVTIFSAANEGVIYYFVQHQLYFEREACYGFGDDGERFAYFQQAVVEMLCRLDYFPDVIHANDWHTGMIPFLCKVKYGSDERYARIKHVFMIHNLAYQGNYSADILSLFGVDRTYYENGALRMWDGISYLKAGVNFCDKIMTVSKTYAK